MIKLENLTKQFVQKKGQPLKAVDNVNLNVPEGEMCVLLGPSGCGKTTTLKMINRLIAPSSGNILINGENTNDMDTVTLRRNIGYVIQQIGLFPNMTIEENITVVPRMLGWDKARCKQRAEELMDMVALDARKFLHRYPKEMSGGQQQRIGVIRALAADPPVLLMDEPFGAVDPINREVIQNQFLDMQPAVSLLPLATGLYPATLLPPDANACSNARETTVFPTEVSVPVIKKRFSITNSTVMLRKYKPGK